MDEIQTEDVGRRWRSIEAVMVKLDIDGATVANWRDRYSWESAGIARRVGRVWRYDLDALDAWMLADFRCTSPAPGQVA